MIFAQNPCIWELIKLESIRGGIGSAVSGPMGAV
jgi:hypothetical protein